MNILFINTSRIWGGNEKWTHMAAHGLAENHTVLLAYRAPDLGVRFSVNKLRLPFWNRFDVYTLTRLSRFIKKQGVEMVVSTNRKFYLLGALAARFSGCRHFVRCGIVWEVRDNKYYRILFQKYVDGVIVNAEPIRQRLAGTGFIDEKKIHLIYNGLDVLKLDKSRCADQEKPFHFTIASMGELIPRKGYPELIRAFALFDNKNPNNKAGLVIIGKGKQKARLKKLSQKLGIGDKVFFAGFIDNPYPLLNMADLFVSSSVNEGLPNALVEAMYLKIPVITTAAGGSGEVIEHGRNGWLVEQDNQEQLAGLIENAALKINGQQLNQMGDAANKTAAQKFSLKRMSRQLEHAFGHSHYSAGREKTL